MENKKTPDTQLLVAIFELITVEPKEIVIERRIDEMGVLIEVTLPQKDASVVIGRGGKTADALRTLLKLLGSKEGAKYNLRIHGKE